MQAEMRGCYTNRSAALKVAEALITEAVVMRMDEVRTSDRKHKAA